MVDPFGLTEGVKTLSGSLDASREASKGLSKSIEGIQLDGIEAAQKQANERISCLLYTSPSPRDRQKSRMPSSA